MTGRKGVARAWQWQWQRRQDVYDKCSPKKLERDITRCCTSTLALARKCPSHHRHVEH